MATQALVHKPNLETCRARRRTDATIAKHVRILEGVAKAHNGVLPSPKWLGDNGHWYSYNVMLEHPHAFAHIKRKREHIDETQYKTYDAQVAAVKKGAGEILAPSTAKSLAAYHVPGAQFNPTHLDISPGIDEGEWMNIGRALASVCQAAYWWVGDWIQYGFQTYGKQHTYDLAMQATGYTRTKLYECAYIAKKFPPERRCGALTFFHHQCVASYPAPVADKVLADAAEIGLTARQAADAAAEEAGGPTRKFDNQAKRITLTLWPDTYEALKRRADGASVHF